VAGSSALKNSKTAKKAASKTVAKKSVAKKTSKPAAKTAKKVVAKKVLVKKAPIKIPLKKDLVAKDVQMIVDAKNASMRLKELMAEAESRGITSINRIPKKVDKDLVDEIRALNTKVPVMTEKLRKLGLGSPYRMLKKTELALIAPPPAPVAAKGRQDRRS